MRGLIIIIRLIIIISDRIQRIIMISFAVFLIMNSIIFVHCFIPRMSRQAGPSKTSLMFNMKDIADLLAAIPAILSKNRLNDEFPSKIANSKITKSTSKKYVHRFELEQKIISIQNITPSGIYWIVYGAKGVGKSESIDHTAIEKEGVIKIIVTSANSRDDIVSALTKKVLGFNTTGLTPELLSETTRKCSVIPTIIFDIELGGSLDQTSGIQAVRSVSKLLAHTCRCIVILSEANTVLQFGQDEARVRFLYVDEPTYDEAKTLLQRLGIKLTETDMQCLFDSIGTNPAMLIHMADTVMAGEKTVREYIDDLLAKARRDLIAFPHQAILQALKEHPEGVSPEYFNNQKSNGIDLSNPMAVGEAMKRSNAVIYRIELGLYTLMSIAHRTALSTYTPKAPGDGLYHKH